MNNCNSQILSHRQTEKLKNIKDRKYLNNSVKYFKPSIAHHIQSTTVLWLNPSCSAPKITTILNTVHGMYIRSQIRNL